MSDPTPTSMPLRYATWISDVELAFYSSLASIKINHDKLDSSARKVLGLRPAPEFEAWLEQAGIFEPGTPVRLGTELPRALERALSVVEG